MSLGTVLVIEDDPAIRRGVIDALKFVGYKTLEAADGRAGLAAASGAAIDLLLLDVVVPHKNGFEILEELRKTRPTLPVIMLTARGTEEDRIRGLKGGADDYVVKPFSAKELLARVEAVLRRSAERPTPVKTLEIQGRRVDFSRREIVLSNGGRTELSEKEAALLHYLAQNPGRAIAREELLQRVWGLDPRGMHTRTVDMHIARLREALGDDAESPAIVLTVRSKGYMLGRPGDNA